MSTKAQTILNEIQALPLDEQREISQSIQKNLVAIPTASRRRTIREIAGKYRAAPNPEAKDHDRGFADAVAD